MSAGSIVVHAALGSGRDVDRYTVVMSVWAMRSGTLDLVWSDEHG